MVFFSDLSIATPAFFLHLHEIFNFEVSLGGLLQVHLVWDSLCLCASWAYMSIFFTRLGKFSSLFFQIGFQFLAFFF